MRDFVPGQDLDFCCHIAEEVSWAIRLPPNTCVATLDIMWLLEPCGTCRMMQVHDAGVSAARRTLRELLA